MDERVQAAAQRQRNPGADKFAKNIQQLGERYSFAVLGGFYAAGSVLDDANAKMVAMDGLSASIIAGGIITPVLKVVAGRSRPHADQGAHDFHPFNGSKSFPSGHTTQAFSVASVIAQHYESPWVSASAYGVATLVGYARIEQNAHFLSDVLAGAMIGIGVGKSVVTWNRKHQAALAVFPLLVPGERGIELSCAF